jgi:hypothetical protein
MGKMEISGYKKEVSGIEVSEALQSYKETGIFNLEGLCVTASQELSYNKLIEINQALQRKVNQAESKSLFQKIFG